MKKRWIVMFAVVLMVVVGTAMASSGGPYVLDWYTIDGGGGTSSGGVYEISGTIGQPDAGEMSGGDYAVSGGFWGRFVESLHELFLPLIMR